MHGLWQFCGNALVSNCHKFDDILGIMEIYCDTSSYRFSVLSLKPKIAQSIEDLLHGTLAGKSSNLAQCLDMS